MSKPSQHIHLHEVNMMQIEVKIKSTHFLTLIYQGFREDSQFKKSLFYKLKV